MYEGKRHVVTLLSDMDNFSTPYRFYYKLYNLINIELSVHF